MTGNGHAPEERGELMDGDGGGGEGAPRAGEWLSELRELWALAWPNIIQGAAQQAMLVTDQLFLGRISTNALAAASLGNIFHNVLFAFLLGASTGLDTLGAQAHGAGSKAALVNVTLTAAFVLTVATALACVALLFGAPVARAAFGQPDDVAALVGDYCRGLAPGMWPLMMGVVTMKYLQIQGDMATPAIATVAAALLNAGFNAALVAAMGFDGAPLATSASRTVQALLLIAAVAIKERGGCAAVSIQGGAAASAAAGALAAAPGGDEESVSLLPRADERLADRGGVSTAADSARQETYPLMGEQQQQSSSANSAGAGEGKGGGVRPVPKAKQQQQQQLQGSFHEPGQGLHVLPHGARGVDGGGFRGPDAPPPPHGWLRSPSMLALSRSHGGGGADAPAGDGQAGCCGCLRAHGSARWLLAEAAAAVRPAALVRFARLAAPGGAMLAFEASSFDVTTALAGRLGPAVTASHAAMLAVIMLTYFSIPFAVATAATIRVGNLLGAGLPRLAQVSGRLAIVGSVSFMLVSAAIILGSRNVIGHIFSEDPQVISIMATIAPYAALFQVSDGLLGSCQGILRACGRQALLLVCNLLVRCSA